LEFGGIGGIIGDESDCGGMRYLVKTLLTISVLVIFRAAYGFFLAYAAWAMDGSVGALVLRTPYNPAIPRNFELWSVYLLVSIIVFLVLCRLYRREYGRRTTLISQQPTALIHTLVKA
jgi:hypothetical protein